MTNNVEAVALVPSGGLPNSRLPLLLCRGGLSEAARSPDAAKRFLEGNGWTGAWVWTVYPFWHFHTQGHEVLACVSGTARLGLGGDGGIERELEAGDVVLIPAGVGHKRLDASADFQVAGAYPPDQTGDIVRPGEKEDGALARAIAALPLPASNPLTGQSGGLLRYWEG